MTIDPKQYRPSFIKDAPERRTHDGKPRYCGKCPKQLPNYLDYYCSGKCLMKAREDGSYGKESVF